MISKTLFQDTLKMLMLCADVNLPYVELSEDEEEARKELIELCREMAKENWE